SSIDAEIRLYDRLFAIEDPSKSDQDFRDLLNPDSLHILKGAKVEAYLHNAKPMDSFQFLKHGYFTVDLDSKPNHLIMNRTVSLKDNTPKEKK
ncbi:MAG TPA: glutamine--tRNA ligase, partial [Paludibacteraceae bacterium]|nr:glutamine--tRNA ligase [Paludibacteraceae bacterium]